METAVIYFCTRLFRAITRRLQLGYELFIAPFIAKYLHWMLWPLFRYLKHQKIVFVVNIACGAGHTFFELDNFARMLLLKDADPDKKYVWINKTDYFAKTCSNIYKHFFFYSASKTWLYNLVLPLTMHYQDLILDCGCSRLKWQLPQRFSYQIFPRTGTGSGTYIYQIPKNIGLEQVNRYYARLQKGQNVYPMIPKDPCPKQLSDFLGKDTRKIALIHAKDTVINATAASTDPNTYLPALEHLSRLNYRLIFVGREKMPPLFEKYGLLNYAGSSIASYENDIHLFNQADIMIMSGSGVSVIPDCLGKYFLYLNSWHLAIPASSSKSIHVPAIVKTKKGRFLSFEEQNQLYRSLEDQGAERFPLASYEPQNASGDEILEALRELLALKEKQTPLSPIQMKFRALDTNAPLFYASSRCSEYFLNKHKELT